MAMERLDPTEALLRALMEDPQAPRYNKPPAPRPYVPDWNTQQLQRQLNRDQFGRMPHFERPAAMMTMGMGNPAMTMGAGLPQMGNTSQAPGWGQMPIPQSQPSPDMPAPNAAAAGPASIPMPPQRPASMGGGMPMQLPGARPVEQAGAVSMPSAGMAGILGFNPQAFAGNPQAIADQFTNGELEKLRARTYRNEDGSMWNDYYVG